MARHCLERTQEDPLCLYHKNLTTSSVKHNTYSYHVMSVSLSFYRSYKKFKVQNMFVTVKVPQSLEFSPEDHSMLSLLEPIFL